MILCGLFAWNIYFIFFMALGMFIFHKSRKKKHPESYLILNCNNEFLKILLFPLYKKSNIFWFF